MSDVPFTNLMSGIGCRFGDGLIEGNTVRKVIAQAFIISDASMITEEMSVLFIASGLRIAGNFVKNRIGWDVKR